MTENEQSGKSALAKLIRAGAHLAGGAVGGALGFLAAGPAGAAALGAAGAGAALALQHIGDEAAHRVLAPREAMRVGGVIAIAAAQIEAKLKSGEEPRDDDFFEPDESGRSDAEEVAESVILKSQREPEEKKIPYMGNLLANVVFDDSVDAFMAHHILKIAEELTYRQLCILSLAADHRAYALRASDYRGQGSFLKTLYPILYECADLAQRGLVGMGGSVVFGPTDVSPAKMKIQALGRDMYNLMELNRIPEEDIEPIADQLE